MSSVSSNMSFPPGASSSSGVTISGSLSSPASTTHATTSSPPLGSNSTATSLSSPGLPIPMPGGGGGGGPATHANSHAGPSHVAGGPPGPASAAGGSTASHIQPTLPSAETQRHVAEARAALVASIGNMLDSELQSRARDLHTNAAALDKQEKDMVKATEGLRRENDKLSKLTADASRKVKELGNVQNWAEVLERQFLILEETMRLVREGSVESDSGSGGSRSRSGSCSSRCSGSCCWDRGSENDGPGQGDRMLDLGLGVVEDVRMEGEVRLGDEGPADEEDLYDEYEREERMGRADDRDWRGEIERLRDEGRGGQEGKHGDSGVGDAKFYGDDEAKRKLDKGKGKEMLLYDAEGNVMVEQMAVEDAMDLDVEDSHFAMSETSQSANLDAESTTGSGSRTKGSETTSISAEV